jgi:hypothetical protein
VMREPPLAGLLHHYRRQIAATEGDFDETLGPLHRISAQALGTRADSGSLPEVEWHRLPVFKSALSEAVGDS